MNVTVDGDQPGWLLHQAAIYDNLELMRSLLEGPEESNINSQDSSGRTPLYTSVANNSLNCCHLLLNSGADANLPCGAQLGGMTPLHNAAARNNLPILKLLLERGADIHRRDASGKQPIELAETNRSTDCANAIREKMGRERQHKERLQKEFLEACLQCDTERARNVSIDPSFTLQDVMTIVHGYRLDGLDLLYRACDQGSESMCEFLLQTGAPIVANAKNGQNAFHVSCLLGRINCARLLLQQNPDLVNIATIEGSFPLHLACLLGQTEIVMFLLTSSAKHQLEKTSNINHASECVMVMVNARDALGQTPLHIAVANRHIALVQYFIRGRLIIDPEGSRRSSDSDVGSEYFPASSDDVSLDTDDVKSASSSTELEILFSVNIDADDVEGKTPLHLAVLGDGKVSYNDIVGILLLHNANLNREMTMSHSSTTVLMEAVQRSDLALVDLLLSHGAKDDQLRVLKTAVMLQDDGVISCLIKRHSYLDSDYKVGQKRLREFLLRTAELAGDLSLPALDPFAVMICWHGLALQKITQLWIQAACEHHIRHRLPDQLKEMATYPSFLLLFVTRVDISGNSLSVLPSFLFSLPNLKILNASFNQIRAITKVSKSGIFEQEFSSNLPVDFQCDDFDDDIETDCPMLEELDLQKNHIFILPASLFKLPSLRRLNASNNSICSLPFDMWTSSSLVELNLANNRLENLPYYPDSSASESYDQRDLSLSGFSPLCMETGKGNMSFPCQHAMNYSGVEIGDAAPVGEQVDLRKEYSAIPATYVNCWQERVQVEIGSSAQDFDKKVEQHSQLKELVLSGNQFDEVPHGLPCLAPGLEKLCLAHNRLKEVGSPSLYPARLKSLDLSHNLISCDAKKRKSVPIADRNGVLPAVHFSSLCFSPFHSRSFSPVMTMSASNPMLRRFSSSTLSSSSPTLSTLMLTPLVCHHRLQQQFVRLKSLKLDNNRLTKFSVRREVEDDLDAVFNAAKDGSPKTKLSFEYPLSRGCQTSRDKGRLKSDRLEQKDLSDWLLYPNLILLDLSNNDIDSLSADISELTQLAELKISSNRIRELPPEMGLMKKLWFLDFSGCPVEETLRSLLGEKISRTLTVLSYLKSVREEAKPFNRMKLMFVGKQGIGKTSLLGHLRYQTGDRNKFTHWAQRMGHEMKGKDLRGENISTVGVDIGTFEIQRGSEKVVFSTWDFGGQKEYYATHQYFLSKRSLYVVVWKVTEGEEGVNEILPWLINIQARAPNAPVIIVGTHRDALRKNFPRARLDDLGELIERKYIQVADPDKLGLPRVLGHLEVSCKGGLMSRTYISQLVDMIWKVANEEHQPGNQGTRLLDQLVPASYLHLQDVVTKLAEERKREGKDPVLYAGQYKHLVIGKMEEMYGVSFQDISELNQATQFLHENGILLHYEDINLRDIYFLDPQWLCDMLASVITIREINGLVRSGLMMVDDLKLLFKKISFKSQDIRSYIVDLLQKFEVALLWNESSLVIPSLLPMDRDLVIGRPGQNDVIIPVQGSGRDISDCFLSSQNNKRMTCYANGDQPSTHNHSYSSDSYCQQTPKNCEFTSKNKFPADVAETGRNFRIRNVVNPVISVVRLYIMSYFPSGFWPRLISRVLGDSQFYEMLKGLYNFSVLPMSFDELTCRSAMIPRWRCWQTGAQLQLFGLNMLQVKEVTDYSRGLFDYRLFDLAIKPEDQVSWSSIITDDLSILEILIHNETLEVEIDSETSNNAKAKKKYVLYPDSKMVALLMTRVIECIDLLLEDWYPDIGIRFTQNTRGMYLITRLVPCTRCFLEYSGFIMKALGDEVWSVVDSRSSSCADLNFASESESLSHSVIMHLSHPERIGRTLSISRSRGVSGVARLDDGVRSFSCDRDHKKSVNIQDHCRVKNNSGETDEKGRCNGETDALRTVYCYTVEQCLQVAQLNRVVFCPCHGNLGPFFVASSTGLVYSGHVAPDTVFHDISDNFLVDRDSIILKKFLGKGAFGAVYSGSIVHKHSDEVIPVALKMLQPVRPPDGATYSQKQLYSIEKARWDRDPLKNCCEAYLNARKELSILLLLKHEHMVPLVGVSVSPLCLVLSLAPHGALNSWLKNYSNAGAKLSVLTFHQIIFQVSTALEYLHCHQVIYRDLKSENVLVWSLPPPHSTDSLHPVDVKLADYGVSRVVLPFGTKGFAGTLSFMAPEIMQHGGEEAYTEKVDCFSFGMFMYELLLLRPPYDDSGGNNPGSNINIKGHVLAGGRPTITSKEVGLPSNILDLMTLCWSSDPSDRPSAAEIVSFLSRVEFSRLCNAVMLDDDYQDVICCCSAPRPLAFGDQKVDGLFALNGVDRNQCDVWLSMQGLAPGSGSMLVYTYEGQDCVESKKINFDFDSVVTCMCVTETDIWCSCTLSKIHVFRRLDYSHALSFSASGGSREVVCHMVYGKTEGQVYVVLGRGQFVVYSGVKNIETLPKSIEYQGNDETISSITPAQNLRSEIWCGQSKGRIQIWRFRVGAVCQSTLVHSRDGENTSDTSHLVNSCSDSDVIWSYVCPVVFRWSARNRNKTGQIDLTQVLVPYTDQALANPLKSLNSIGSYLYIGTMHSFLLIIDAKSLDVVNMCQTHEHPIPAIVPLSLDYASGRNPEHKDIGWMDRAQFSPTSSTFATVGKGYRDLVRTVLQRYQREKSNLCDRLFILTWNGDDWVKVNDRQSVSTVR